MLYFIDTIKSALTPVFERYGVRKAILFGSFAKNTVTERSDIDLLVDSGLRGLRFVGLTEEISNAVSRPADILDITHIEKNSRVCNEIRTDGVTIFENS